MAKVKKVLVQCPDCGYIHKPDTKSCRYCGWVKKVVKKDK